MPRIKGPSDGAAKYAVPNQMNRERPMAGELLAQPYEKIKRQASELQEKNAELERASDVKLTFLRFMSHEVRTPLTISMGYSGLLLDGLLGPLSEEQSKAVKAILGQSTDLLTLIDNVLEATRLETVKDAVDTHEVDLRKLMGDLKAGYSTPLHKDIALEWRLSPELPAIKTDVGKIKGILRNLLSNAIKFTEQGSVILSVRCLRAEQAIELKVEDTGIGIPERLKSKIFDLFCRVNSPDMRVHEGMGLGLYIVKKYTELLGGKVEIESEVGKGSTFTVTLPVTIYDDLFEL
ncbi:MAG TPA: HAMP domain-containing sensor histidine kinase [Candidatus Binatia bacterium]|jgi:signal transduction histidine kinase